MTLPLCFDEKDAVAYQELQRKSLRSHKRLRLPRPASEITRAPRRHARQKAWAASYRGSRDDLAAFIAQHNL